MEKGFRLLLAGWIVLSVVTAGFASYNDHLDSLPGCVSGDMCSQPQPESCRHGTVSSAGQLNPLRNTFMIIFRSLEFPCDGAILNVTMPMNVSMHEEQGIELQVWRFYPNNSLMLVQWAETRRIECVGCTKTPLYLSAPLLFRKGDVLGIYRYTDTADLGYSSVVPQNFAADSSEALVLQLTGSMADEIHQRQGEVVTNEILEKYSDGLQEMIVTFSRAFPLIELELSLASVITSVTSGVDTPTVNLATPTPTPLPPQQTPAPTDPSSSNNQLSIFTIAIIVSIVSVAFVAISIVMLSVMVILCLRRCRLRKNVNEHAVEVSEPVVDKGTPVTDIVSEYDEVGQTFLPASRSMTSSVASVAHGRYEVNQIEARVPSLDTISGPTLDSSLVSNGICPLPSLGFDHDYSAVGPATNQIGEYDLPDENQGIEDVYVHPPCTEKELYSQLTRRHYEDIDRKYIEFVRCIGVGEFGRVCMGYWNTKGYRRKVAIKTLNLQAEEKDRIRFLQEAAIMAQFRHPNIVNLFGVVKDGEPKMIVLELMDMGDLRGVLMDAKSALGETTSKDLSVLLLKFSRQISDGMDYLAKKCFIHRDLAARNILVTDDYVCKIGDFGLARDLVYDSYYLSSGGLVPVRWTAPEALIFGRFSSASDVWSFAALLYEIWSLGHKPFEDVDNQEVVQLVQTGHRLPPPPGCPRMVYSVMISCWHPQAHLRPDFSDVRGALRQSQMNVLQWAHEDMNEDPLSLHLGAPLIHGKDLFIDLQNTYLQTDKGSY